MKTAPLWACSSQRMTAAEIFLKYESDDSGVIQIEELNCMLEDVGHEISQRTSQELRSGLDHMDEEITFDAFANMVSNVMLSSLRRVPSTCNSFSDEPRPPFTCRAATNARRPRTVRHDGGT